MAVLENGDVSGVCLYNVYLDCLFYDAVTLYGEHRIMLFILGDSICVDLITKYFINE